MDLRKLKKTYIKNGNLNVLDDACENGDIEIVRWILQYEYFLPRIERLLFYACKGKQLQLIDSILKYNQSINFGFTIHEISIVDIVVMDYELLLYFLFSENVDNSFKITSLLRYILNFRLDIQTLIKLISVEWMTSVFCEVFGASLMFELIDINDISQLQNWSLQFANARNKNGWSPIYHAVDSQNMPALSILYEKWDSKICHDIGLFANAVMFNKIESVKWLADKYGIQTHLDALLIAIQENFIEIVIFLITKNPALVNHKDKHGWSACYIAVEHGRKEILDILLINWNKIKCHNLSLIEYACRNGKVSIAKHIVGKLPISLSSIEFAIGHSQELILEWIITDVDTKNLKILGYAVCNSQNLRAKKIINAIISTHKEFIQTNVQLIFDEDLFGFAMIEKFTRKNNKEMLEFMHNSKIGLCSKTDILLIAVTYDYKSLVSWLIHSVKVKIAPDLLHKCIINGSHKCMYLLFLANLKPPMTYGTMERKILINSYSKALKKLLLFNKDINSIICEYLESWEDLRTL